MSEGNQVTFLQKFIQSSITQKVRIQDTIKQYETLLKDVTERIIDQVTLIQQAQAAGWTADKIAELETRLKIDTDTKQLLMDISYQLSQGHIMLTNQLQAHLLQLANVQITAGGFVTHIFGLSPDVKFDDVTKIMTMKSGSHAESAISTDLTSWKDSSQMTIVIK